jgi:hypothetical protein
VAKSSRSSSQTIKLLADKVLGSVFEIQTFPSREPSLELHLLTPVPISLGVVSLMVINDPVVRFCPKCGAKVKGPEDTFLIPQNCPSCKSTVLFWDVTKEPVGEVAEALKFKPLFLKKWLLVGGVVGVVIFVLSLLLFAIGFVAAPFMLAVLMLLIGGYCIAIFFGQQHKTSILNTQLIKALESLESARDQQVAIATKFTSLQSNFSQLVDSATKTAVTAQSDYEEKLLELAQAYATRRDELESDFANRNRNEIERLLAKERTINETVRRIAIKYLDETKKTLAAKLTPDNFIQTRDRFHKAVEFCQKVGFDVPSVDVVLFVDELKQEYEAVVRKQLAREEQARIKERLREEQKVEQDFERERKRLDSEEKVLERLLAEARSKATEESAMQIADLERRIAEAEEKKRALSMAQQTRAGNVYVISNIGSFGTNVFKIGMTRRLEPLDRVKELGDASVPFPFDVHMMIACKNAPTLESELHKRFSKQRLNKVNFRKEFFRLSIAEIQDAVTELHGTVEYVAEPEALQYNESICMTDADFEFVQDAIGNSSEDMDD